MISIAKLCHSFFWISIAAFGQSTGAVERFAKALPENRFAFKVEAGVLSGPGKAVLEKAIGQAQYVFLGEQHGTTEVPLFTAAVCGMTRFQAMAVEIGPQAAQVVDDAAHGQSSLADYVKRFPYSVAFYDWKEEMDAVRKCVGDQGQVWGLDQEFIGSPGPLLDAILKTKPEAEATELTRRLVAQNSTAYDNALKSGNPGELFMFTAKDEDLARLMRLLRNPHAKTLLKSLIDSRAIYLENGAAPWDSNLHRAMLMKTNLASHPLSSTKVLFKFGSNHGYKGFNPLHVSDLGNYVTEVASGQGRQSVHIMVVGVTGGEQEFAGIGKPPAVGSIDLTTDRASHPELNPFVDARITDANGSWTIYDLRGISRAMGSKNATDAEVERLIHGYDLLVLAPKVMPSKPIQ